MARHSVVGLLVAGAFVAACVSATTEPASSPAATASPERTLVAPTSSPTQPPPSATPRPTTVPAATDVPERTLAPGETPSPAPLDVSAYLTATMSVVNLTDEPVDISIDIFSEGENQGTVANLDIEPYGSIFQSVPETSYAVTFTRGASDPVTCFMTLAEAGELAFTVVGTDILVIDPKVEVATPADLFVETSSLCAS